MNDVTITDEALERYIQSRSIWGRGPDTRTDDLKAHMRDQARNEVTYAYSVVAAYEAAAKERE